MLDRREILVLGLGAGMTAFAAQRTIAALPNAIATPPFGMNLYLWTQTVTPAFFPLIRRLRAIGYQSVEIPIIHGTGQHLIELRRVLEGEGLFCTTLSAVTQDADPASPDSAVRRAGLETLRWAIDASHVLGSKILSGPLYAASAPPSGAGGPSPDALQWSAGTLAAACDYGSAAGVCLCLEFLNRFEGYLLNTAEETMALIRAVAAPNLGVAFDTHHAQIEERSLGAAITTCGDRLFHTHISESNRGTLGRGTIAWDQVFAALKAINYSGSLTVEAFAKDVQPLATSAHVWRNTFESKDQVARDGLTFLRQHWRS
ncbi:sugar phosphate isomerase/epimerase family protein [Glacieibacterium megasporae]|uniref:sugar phosphate isomerase/epimerase family protein n=1 Tax=Glacieibacterium megasporae TaxID=2835787 RepID=UPI001C1DEFCD|nr:sugar phosphate isomerase/epimerase [Polymorphobacter megasporae]UAJ10581.1 sugar phosphate isomerase/epimerase [Polymorphobacter megasporae]